jgi:epoxyqueuosine reductase
VPGTVRVICVRLDYWPACAAPAEATLADGARAYVSRYALGRDYHRLMRNRLQDLADAIGARIGAFGHRVFVDTGPVLEKPLARNAGLGWIGKHTNLIHPRHGSYFVLGEIYTDLPLAIDPPASEHCGSCQACLPACPTGAIVSPWRLDARRCISYLTIELKGSIPEPLRPLMGNRIYGCDDCQLVCPWNKFARATRELAFEPRHHLDGAIPVELRAAIGNRIYGCDDCQLVCPWNKYAKASPLADFDVRPVFDGPELLALWAWSEEDFQRASKGSAIRRIGHVRWLRNIAVALGNAPPDAAVVAALEARLDHRSPLVREHVRCALARHAQAAPAQAPAHP